MHTLYFVRHGQSEANAAGITAGCRIDAPLTEQGRHEAKLAAAQLAGLPIDTVVSSPMVRAHQTARIIADDIDYAGEIHTNKLLVERDFGDATGIRREGQLANVDPHTPGLESEQQLFERMKRALAWLKTVPGDHVLVTGHAGSGRMLQVVANGGTVDDFATYERLQNAHIYKMEL
ncbi:MAG TPA: histidine phosphatase family protein [Candidatus Saccharimonas sp.]|nr:histidine phosphatase family protein [Candidatus Saccharimonas sp.]